MTSPSGLLLMSIYFPKYREKERYCSGSHGRNGDSSRLLKQKGRKTNPVIVSQTKKTSFAIKAMFDRALNAYPISMLYRLGQQYNDNEKKIENVGLSGDYKRLPQRDCTITVASYESPDALRGDAYALVHCSEVGLWTPTDKKSPESVVRSACSGIAFRPYTMIIYESTANGTGNFFHREYLAAKEGKSQFDALFVSWKEIELYSLPFDSEQQKAKFAEWLYDNRDNDYSPSEREENGKYLFSLWNDGATLEAINWYISERKKYTEHADMASEYPSNDIEAFTFSGRRVFPDEDIEQFRPACRQPRYIGEVYGKDDAGTEAMENLRFKNEKYGRLMMWDDVEHDDEEDVTERYLVVVDVCKGMSEKADWSVITVFDRLFMMDGLGPTVVAQWRGHIDMDMLAWKAAQIAEYYNHALLVIESNTLETNNTKGEAEYILTLIRDVYDNLYARKQSPEDIKEGRPRKYGYHTNVSTKKTIIHNLKAVLRDHLYTERDQGCLDEYATYIENEGRFEAPVGYHDDRLMTRAIGMQICFHEMGIPKIVKKENRNPNKVRKVVSAATI